MLTGRHRVADATLSEQGNDVVVQSRKAVSVYFTNKQILPFAFAEQIILTHSPTNDTVVPGEHVEADIVNLTEIKQMVEHILSISVFSVFFSCPLTL